MAMLQQADIVAVGALHDVGRNLIHNALFSVAQRGVGPWTAFNVHTVDRWITNGVLDVISWSQYAVGDTGRAQIGDEEAGFAVFNTFTGNAGATAFNLLQQKIENVRRLAGRTATVSFWAASNAGTLKIGINLFQSFGTGGSPSAGVQVLATGAAVTVSSTWTRYSATITVPSIASKTLGTNNDHFTSSAIVFLIGANSNAQCRQHRRAVGDHQSLGRATGDRLGSRHRWKSAIRNRNCGSASGSTGPNSSPIDDSLNAPAGGFIGYIYLTLPGNAWSTPTVVATTSSQANTQRNSLAVASKREWVA